MTSHQAVKSFKKSSVPGVIITQFVDDIPNGCSTPDFERKPVTLTLQEGKNAIFRAVVKGVPTPEVKWTRMQGGMDDPAKYETFFNNVTNEFILQINKLTTDDSDLYRCFAVNEYGEAACSAGLRIIQVGFKRKARYVPVHPADELKKKLQDFRKLLRKRAPAPKPKPLDKEAVWQLLLHADRRDYEKICMKYGIVDFRGMLRKLQEMRKDTESEQGELLHSIRNFEHIKVNKDGKATFSLVMDLKNHNSKVYLLKDGERLRYGTGDEYRKHCLRRIGKRYSFIVNDVQPEDAGVYQVRVEDIPVFSTELDAESIPVRFQQPLSDVRCPEEEDAVFDCILRTPCYDAVWLHKTHLLEGSEKHQISVTPDGLTHQLIIRNVVPSDNGMYTLDTGLCSSNAWLIVEYAKGKRRQGEGDERQKSEWLKETLPDKDRAKKLRRREYVGDEDHLMDTDVEKDGWYRNGQIGSEGHSTDVDGNHRFLGKDELHGPHRNRRMGFGQFSGAELGGDSMTNDDSNFGLKGLGGKTGLRPFRGKDSMTGRADTGDELGGAGEWYSADGRDDGMVDAVNIDMDNGEGVRSQHGKDGKLGDSRYRAGFGGVGRLGATDGSSVLNRLDPDSTGVGDGKGGKGDLLSRTSPGTGARKNAAGAEIAGGMKSPYGKDGLPTVLDMNGANINREGQIGTPYGKDGPTLHASGHLGQEGRSDLLDSPGLLPAGHGAISGAGGSSIGEMEAPYGPDGRTVGASIGGAAVAGAGAVGSPYGKDGLPTATGIGGAGIAGVGGVWSAYGKDGFPAGAGIGGAGVAGVGGVGSPYGKDGLPAGAGVGVASAGGVGSPYGKDGLPAGVGVGGAGAAGAEGIASPYGKDGLPAGAGVGVAGAGGVGSPYGKDGLPAGAGIGVAGVAGVGGVGSPYGKDGLPAGAGMGGAGVAGVGGVGSPYGKDGLPAGAGIGGAGVAGAGGVGSPYGKDGLPAGAVIGGAGVAGSGGVGSPYGKDGLPARAGIGGASVGGAGGVGSPYGKDGFPAGTGVGGAGGVGSPYGKDGLPAGASMGGAGVAGVGGVGSPYGKDGLPAGAGIGGPGVAGVGGVGSPYGKDGLPAGAGIGGTGVGGAGGVGSPYGKDGLPAGAVIGGPGVAGAGGVGSPYGKDGLPARAGIGGTGVGGAGGVGSPYGKDGLPAGAVIGGPGVAGAGGVGSPYGKDGLPAGAVIGGAGVAGAGGVGSPYGKDGLPAGAGVGGAGVAGAGGVGSPYGKHGLPAGAVIGGAGIAGAGVFASPYGKDGLPAGAGVGGAAVGVFGGIGSPYGKDGLLAGNGIGGAGVDGAGGVWSPCGKDGLPAGAGVGGAGIDGAGGFASPYGKDGLTPGAGAGGTGVAGAGGFGSPYGKDGLPAGAGVGGAAVGVFGGIESPYGKDGLPAGVGVGGVGVAGAGGVGSPCGKDGLPPGAGFGGAGVAGAGGVGFPYGKDGLPAGTDIGGAGAGAVQHLYGKDSVPTGAGVSGGGVACFGGIGSPYGKDGLPAQAGIGAGVGGAWEVGSPYGKDGLPAGAGVAGGAGGEGGFGSPCGKDGVPAVAGAGVGGAAALGSTCGKDGLPAGAGVGGRAGAGGVGSPYGKDGLPAGTGVGGAGVAGAGGVGSPYGKDGVPVGAGVGGIAGAGGVGSPYGKQGLPAGTGIGGAAVAGAGGVASPCGKDGHPAGAAVAGAGIAGAGGVGSPYGKDGLPARAGIGGASVAGAGGVGSPYGKDGLPASARVADAAGAGVFASPYGKDHLPAGAGPGATGVGGAGRVGSPYGKDGLPASAGVADAAGAGVFASPYGKDHLPAGAGPGATGVGGAGRVGSPYGKDGLPAGGGGGGVAGVVGVGSPYGKDGLPAGAGPGATGVGGAGGVGSPYGKDGLPAGGGVGGVAGVGGVGSPYGKDGLPAGAGIGGAGVAGAGAVGSPYGKDHLPAGTGVAGAGGVRSPYGKDGPPAGAGIGGAGVAGAGGVGSPCGKDGLLAGTGVAGVGGVGSPYGKGGLPTGAVIGGAGVAGAGGVGSPYGKDGLPAGPAGVGLGGSGVAGARGIGSPYGKDGLPVGMGAGAGSGGAGFGRSGSPYGKDGLPTRAVAGAAHFPFGGEEVMGSRHGRDALLSRAQGGAAGNGFSSEGGGVSGSAIRGAGSPYGKDSGSAGARAGVGGVGRLGGDERELHSVPGKEGVVGAVGRGGEYGLDSHSGKSSMGGKTGKGTASEFRASGNKGSSDDRDSLSGQRDARSEGRDLGYLGSLYGKNSAFGGAGSKSHNRSVDGRNSGGFGQGSLDYGQMSDLYGGPPSINQRKQEPSLDIKANDFLKNTESMGKRRRYCLDDLKAPRCYVNKQLLDVRVLKGEPAELSCTVSKHEVAGTWFKDGLKLTNMDGVLFEKEGLVHKLIINKVEDIHAGKYRFEGGDIKTEASIFVEDPPQVDKVLLKNLTSVPTVAKAGQKVKIKIPFEGRLPIRATWLKDRMELVDDARIRVDKTETFTMLSISSSERKDCGDYQVRLKNDSGVLEINLKLMVIDKPQPPAGPIKIVESSANNITIQWKPPKDDGGKPVQRYIVERQQVGKNDWVTLGETPRSCTTFTANKVEQDRSYYFRVRAVNAEGTSDALESDEVKAAGKASPGAPDPPEIVSASRDTITICWKAPRKTGSSRIVGYIVQKRKKGTMTWLPVNNVPIADKKLKMTNLKKGLQYEFRVAAVNAAGIGDASEPSQPVFARDSMKSPGRVQDLKVSSSDSTSVTLTWKRPEAKDGSDVKGYEVEMRSSKSLNWTKCNNLPIEMTTYTVKGLQAKEIYFLRVRALNDSGPGEAAELEACIEAAPPVVSPRLLIDDTVKSFLVIKAGNTIRVNIPFEASPDPVVTWLKDGLPLSNRAKINTKDGTTQLLIAAAEFADSGTYTVELQNGLGRRETFSFEVQITDIPQSPGPIQLEENVPNTVTVTWEPSPSEKWESNLYYTVLKRESQKGLWHVVGDLIYTNKFTFTKLIPGRDYYFRVVAKNSLGASDPSETVQPWSIRKPKAEFQVKPQKYRGVNQNQPPRFLVPLKPHVVTTGSECHMSCAVGGHPPPKITWYKDSRDLSNDPTYFCTNDFGVCSLVVLGVTKHDEGEYMVEATNESGRAFSKAFLTIKDSTL
ncbi:immunoglobulin-like and fibronectin type III domain-containing protein 1 isoform X7 [Aquila chrysaetos chrysaetos]|uniref:immunoglobulin-like and fibronectin type III domain-containing protein 1 isoform X7 n=1 Tax=Aquila chrysaetos chrysaetos TaxID=223781 RepID=UPI001176C1D9|nr:immunoglobulin-like and fibronectin type III domain-containing protein 1 isoform X7 [Aquila chrysaetos chrysaetos]